MKIKSPRFREGISNRLELLGAQMRKQPSQLGRLFLDREGSRVLGRRTDGGSISKQLQQEAFPVARNPGPLFSAAFRGAHVRAQFKAKHKPNIMKKKRSLHWDSSAESVTSPAFPVLGCKLFDELRFELAHSYGDRLYTLNRLANMLSIPMSTAHDWFRVAPCPQVQALMCLLERLPQKEWQRILRRFLREYPTLQHPRIAHDPAGIEALKAVLMQQAGLTIIQGGTGDERSFLFTALGHEFPAIDRRHRLPIGLDLNEPRKLVPVVGITYLRRSLTVARKREIICEEWMEIVKCDAPLLLLSGVLDTLPELQSEILSIAGRMHVILVDAQAPAIRPKAGPATVRVINLTKAEKRPSLLSVSVEAV